MPAALELPPPPTFRMYSCGSLLQSSWSSAVKLMRGRAMLRAGAGGSVCGVVCVVWVCVVWCGGL
jgi:hypothetical protein